VEQGPTKDDLPVPDYDHLELGSLAASIRSLDSKAVQLLLGHEREHGNRLPAVQVLERRLEELSGAEAPVATSGRAASHEAPPPSGGSKVTPATEGPAVNPPSQGDPTNPAQPKS
jgi:hypothetical protein